MFETPAVTVLMPVYNSAGFLRQAVQSILQQAFSDFELLVINDGSTDESASLLDAIKDPRLRILLNEQNFGLTRSLKLGIEEAQGKYIARMDADDIARPDRLEQQVAFLEAHPKIGIVGSAYKLMDQNGQVAGEFHLPVGELLIRWTSLLSNPFAHPTVMVRRDVLMQNKLNYDERFPTAQDYDLWTRVLRFAEGANLEQPLLLYRVHSGGITTKHRKTQLKNHDIVAWRTIQELFSEMEITLEQVSRLRQVFVGGDHDPDLDMHRISLIKLYMDMLNAFLSRYPNTDPGWSDLRRQELLKLVRVVLRSPLRSEIFVVWRQLFRLEPKLPWFLLKQVPVSIKYRLSHLLSKELH